MPKKTKAEKEQETQKNIEEAWETRTIFHRFTESEIQGLNEKVTELSKKSREFSEKKKLLDSIVKGTEAEITKTLKELDEGGEERSMDCPVILDYAEKTYTVKHPDTGDVLDQRPLTAKELQQDLFPKGEPREISQPDTDGEGQTNEDWD